METPYRATADTYVLPSYEPAPGFGLLPVNAFLIQADEPVLVDTGMPKEREEFLEALWSLVHPHDLRWVVMTHEEKDHAGNLREVLNEAPNARLVTVFVGLAKLLGEAPVPLERVQIVNPDQSFSAGDRRLTVVVPPVFDSAATIGLLDTKTEVLFTSDAFGAFVPAPAEDVADIPEQAFGQGFALFNSANHPWTALVDRDKFAGELERIRRLQPKTILSTHLPPARGKTEALLSALAEIPGMDRFVGPDNEAVQAMLVQVAAGIH